MKKYRIIFIIITIVALLCLTACQNSPPQENTDSPVSSSLTDEISKIADAEISESDDVLAVTLHINQNDEKTACTVFFEQAEAILSHCLSDTSYTGVSFTLSVNDTIVASFSVLIQPSGMVALPPTAVDSRYSNALSEAFYDSAFAAGLQE